MKFIDNIKGLFSDVKDFSQNAKKLSAQVKLLQAQVASSQELVQDVQTEVNKMNFKNKPHLDRIQEAQKDMQAELAKYHH
ncbi:hypothetical protein [Eupransor demetentiae]|uniref:Uncharacterized protein n=1 Tax=Eupransor demetentiae TaxID=3109584 RepID=A0ABM9N3N2_9LACO|nr:hypothetical protein R54876_GBNLAHCA_00317 [Lactobacillaceae bacterium LMG 33000]